MPNYIQYGALPAWVKHVTSYASSLFLLLLLLQVQQS